MFGKSINSRNVWKKTLEYFPVGEISEKEVCILDVGCKRWHYLPYLLEFINENFVCKQLLGVDNDTSLKDLLLKYFKKPAEFKLMAVEDLGQEFNEHFDIVTYFKPEGLGDNARKRKHALSEVFDINNNPFREMYEVTYKQAYEAIVRILKPGGIFFGTTYHESEMSDLAYIIKDVGLKIIKGPENNEHDPMRYINGCIVSAKKC